MTKEIDTVEKLCNVVGCDISDQVTAQLKIEHILIYLEKWNVIENFNQDRLDWLFSDEQSY